MHGKEMTTDFTMNKFTVKTSLDIHRENYPIFECAPYDEEDSYEACVEEEVIRKVEAILHCSPPWLVTNNDQQVCKGKLNIY